MLSKISQPSYWQFLIICSINSEEVFNQNGSRQITVVLTGLSYKIAKLNKFLNYQFRVLYLVMLKGHLKIKFCFIKNKINLQILVLLILFQNYNIIIVLYLSFNVYVQGEGIPILGSFLRKNQRALKLGTLTLLDTLVNNYSSALNSDLLNKVS